MTMDQSTASQHAHISKIAHNRGGSISNAMTEADWVTMGPVQAPGSKAFEPVPALQIQRDGSEQRAEYQRDGLESPIGYETEPEQAYSPSILDDNLSSSEEPTTIYPPPIDEPPPPPPPGNPQDRLMPVWSVSPSTTVGPPPGPALWQNIPHVYTSRQLVPLIDSTGNRKSYQPDDKVVWLPTFQARTFITCHASTPVEFERHLLVIIYGTEDCFHRIPDPETRVKMRNMELAGLVPEPLPIITNARPARQEVAWVHGGAALRTADTFKELPCRDNRHYRSITSPYEQSQSESDEDDNNLADNVRVSRASIPSCRRCAKIAQAKLSSVGTTYISVIKSTQLQPGLDIQPPTAANLRNASHAINGVDIYRIVKSGSRDAAATQAFYNAGARGLSTVFTCVVRGDVDLRSLAQKGVKRVEGLWQLAEDTDGPVPVFY